MPRDIVIIGGGIVGSCSAYYLTRHPLVQAADEKPRITLLETAPAIAPAASGYAGGLVATWAFPSTLARRSFELHAALAKQHGGQQRWDYRHVTSGEVSAQTRDVEHIESSSTSKIEGNKHGRSEHFVKDAGATKTGNKKHGADVPQEIADWLSPDAVLDYEQIGGPDETVQVHPRKFTQSIAELAGEAGVDIRTSTEATHVLTERDSVVGVGVKSNGKEEVLKADLVVVAGGPWTTSVLPRVPVEGHLAHSITMQPSQKVPAHVLFSSIQSGKSMPTNPELYPRPDNEVYVCNAFNDGNDPPLPANATLVKPDESRAAMLAKYAASFSDSLATAPITAKQACYLPVMSTGGSRGVQAPVIGKAPNVQGLIVATGHTCWGINNGPATGRIVADLALIDESSDVKPFVPIKQLKDHFPPAKWFEGL